MATSELLASVKDILSALSPQERAELDDLMGFARPIWSPQPGPQTQAYSHPADELFFGGAAGGGKSDLLLGLSLTFHHNSIIYRREYPQLRSMIHRSQIILKTSKGYNSQNFIWRLPDGRSLEFGACQFERDVQRYQGRPHDGLFFDEISHFTRTQYIFLSGWLRPADDSGVRCRVVCTGNPPTTAEGRWVIEEWAPWLDAQYHDPAPSGALRWYARETTGPLAGKLIWRDKPGPIVLHSGEVIEPRSRSFIPSHVEDNPVLMSSGYKSVLQSLPEPLRSQMLKGDFSAGLEDHPDQVIPTAHVLMAQSRWTPDGNVVNGQISPANLMGADIARGGKDRTVLCLSHPVPEGCWVPHLFKYPGHRTPDGNSAADLIRAQLVQNPGCATNIDVIGVGGSCYDVLRQGDVGNGPVRPIKFSERTLRRDKSGTIALANNRAAAYWNLRELLDPALCHARNHYVALPPDPELLADLTCVRVTDWNRPGGLLIEDKDDIRKRLGRSPDLADALALALFPTDGMGYPQAINAPRRNGAFDTSRPSSVTRRGFLGRQEQDEQEDRRRDGWERWGGR